MMTDDDVGLPDFVHQIALAPVEHPMNRFLMTASATFPSHPPAGGGPRGLREMYSKTEQCVQRSVNEMPEMGCQEIPSISARALFSPPNGRCGPWYQRGFQDEPSLGNRASGSWTRAVNPVIGASSGNSTRHVPNGSRTER